MNISLLQEVFLSPGVIVQDNTQLLLRLLVAVAIGMLLGLEREYTHKEDQELFAGIRTFPIVAAFGFLAIFIANQFAPWIFIASLFGLMSFIIVSHYVRAKKGEYGGTTDFTLIISFILGALVYLGFLHIAIAATVLILILLSLKIRIKKLMGKIDYNDIASLIKFCIISLIILPLLPNQTFGPYNVLNPHTIWFFVVLIASINFIAYLFMRFIGGNRGILLTGVAGGLLSSTAVSLSFSQKSRDDSHPYSRYYAVAIVLASSIMFLRVIAITYIFNTAVVKELYLPLVLMTLAGLVASFLLIKSQKKIKSKQDMEFKNPLNLGGAIMFGLVFAIIMVLVSLAKEFLGDRGVYLVSALSGLHDVDAITVSVAKLAETKLTIDVVKNAIITGALANTFVKFLITLFVGDRKLKKYSAYGFGSIFAMGILYLVITNFVAL